MVERVAGNPRTCRYCSVQLKWKGEKWVDLETLAEKCPEFHWGHRPSNALRPDQKKAIGQTNV